jgi:ABC-type uncharacterized transport system substrate-binding protein
LGRTVGRGTGGTAPVPRGSAGAAGGADRRVDGARRHAGDIIDVAGREKELPAVFAGMAQQEIAGFVIPTEALYSVFRDQVIGLSARHKIASIFPNREYPHSGGLISFGADIYEHHRIAGSYTARILKGARPAELRLQITTKFDLVINLKTAQALGITVPESIRKLASEVIE